MGLALTPAMRSPGETSTLHLVMVLAVLRNDCLRAQNWDAELGLRTESCQEFILHLPEYLPNVILLMYNTGVCTYS